MSEHNTNKAVGKWDKNIDELKKQEMRDKYLENEEKRKQLASDNQKRRKETDRKRQQETEDRKRADEEQLRSRKRTQEEAYVRYLGRNSEQRGMNLYDKYEAEKRTKKEQVQEVRSAKKWGESASSSKEKRDQNLVALDLDAHALKDMDKIKKFYQQENEKLRLLADFQKEWSEENEELRQSELLDSLDLDKDAVINSKLLGKEQKPFFESYEKMKESFHAKDKQQKEPRPEEEQIKELIGYDSIDDSSAIWNTEMFKRKTPQQPKVAEVKKEMVEQEIERMHKGVQLMNWASKIEEVQESGLTSNASRKTRPREHILQSMNQRIRNTKTKVEPKKEEITRNEEKRKSLQHRKSIEKRYSLERGRNTSQSATKSANKSANKSTQNKKQSQERLPPIKPNFKDSRMTNITAPVRSTLSKDSTSRITAPVGPKTNWPPHKSKQPIPRNTESYFDNPQTTCTQDDNLDMQEFIKEDLCDLNERERQLQRQIKDIHVLNRNKVKGIEEKYRVETGYNNTQQLVNKQKEAEDTKGLATQDQLEDSLIKLDEMLRKQDRKLEYLGRLPIEEEMKESEDSLRVSDSLDTMNPRDEGALLSEIIKLAAKNLGYDNKKLNLQKLKEQLERSNKQPTSPQPCKQSEYNENYSSKYVEQQNQQEVRSQKPKVKREAEESNNKLSYAQIMRIKAASAESHSKQKLLQSQSKQKPFPIIETHPSPPSGQIEQLGADNTGEEQPKEQKISVNERLRRLLLQ